MGRKSGGKTAWDVCLCHLGYQEKEIICGKGYFRNQTAVLCTDEWNADVCIRDQGIYGHPKFDKVFNEDALGNYLSFQFVPTNETFFKGVFCLQPGHYFTYENGELNITRYFEPNFTGDTEKSFEEIVDDVEAVMKESVAMHKISDVEVASYLSSGVDSSYLTYLDRWIVLLQ